MILLIDNYDSFSYNLFQMVGEINPDIKVIRNDEMSVDDIKAHAPEKIIISPGPGRPEDAGVIIDVVKELGKILLTVFALYAPVKVENMILGGGIIRSGGDTKIIMIIDIIGTWCIGIPLCMLAAYVFKWGIVGVYTLLTTEEIFRLVVSLVIFKKRTWMISLS